MNDDGLKRGIHFAVGFVVGGVACAFLAMEVLDTFLIVKEDFDPDAELRWGLIGGLVGGFVTGLLAMWRLDRFWDWFGD